MTQCQGLSAFGCSNMVLLRGTHLAAADILTMNQPMPTIHWKNFKRPMSDNLSHLKTMFSASRWVFSHTLKTRLKLCGNINYVWLCNAERRKRLPWNSLDRVLWPRYTKQKRSQEYSTTPPRLMISFQLSATWKSLEKSLSVRQA